MTAHGMGLFVGWLKPRSLSPQRSAGFCMSVSAGSRFASASKPTVPMGNIDTRRRPRPSAE